MKEVVWIVVGVKNLDLCGLYFYLGLFIFELEFYFEVVECVIFFVLEMWEEGLELY